MTEQTLPMTEIERIEGSVLTIDQQHKIKKLLAEVLDAMTDDGFAPAEFKNYINGLTNSAIAMQGEPFTF